MLCSTQLSSVPFRTVTEIPMGYLIKRDPNTGEIIEWAPYPPEYPPPATRTRPRPPIVYEDQYYPIPYPSRPQRRSRKRPGRAHRLVRKAITWGIGLPWFIFSFILCEIHPAATLGSLGLLFGWALFRSFRD